MSRFGRYAAFVAIAVVVVAIGLAIRLSRTRPERSRRPTLAEITRPFFRHLTATREARKAQILAYFQVARRAADGTVNDPVMTRTFFERLRERDRPPDLQAETELEERFVTHYGEFYDILFVDHDGHVFHSLRFESDLGTNLFAGPLAGTQLAQRLQTVHETTFIDYENYPPSDELAAFFAVPVFATDGESGSTDAGQPAGWFVLQCPLNKLRSIMSNRRSLGRTGETYLVNAQRRMLTESRFRPEPPELRLEVHTRAVVAAATEGAGEQVIEDYRGVQVLSSYDAIAIFGTTWVILAEIDEQEVVTEHFKQHADLYLERIVRDLQRREVEPRTWSPTTTIKRVDTNEFTRAPPDTTLQAPGVATCTAVAALLPRRFAYLAHVGPSDLIYGQPDTGYNDCLGEMLHQIQRFDVYPAEFADLEFTIAAAHAHSFAGAVDRLLEMNVELSQIRFAYNLHAKYATVAVPPETGRVRIEWVAESGVRTTALAADVEDLGSIVKRLLANPE